MRLMLLMMSVDSTFELVLLRSGARGGAGRPAGVSFTFVYQCEPCAGLGFANMGVYIVLFSILDNPEDGVAQQP